MKTETLLYGIIGLLAGILLAGTTAVLGVNNDNHGMMNMMGMNTAQMHDMHGEGMTTDGMNDELRNLRGDDFDKAFIGAMIDHHEGAITMAQQAKISAKHDEIKQMADDIISAQSREIDLLESWRLDWGYKDVPASHGNEMMH